MARNLVLRFPSRCRLCGTTVAKGSEVHYDKSAAPKQRVTCLSCRRGSSPAPAPAPEASPVATKGRRVAETWETAGEFFEACRRPSSLWTVCKSHKRRDTDWAGTETYADALALALTGWPEGGEQLSRGLAIAPVPVMVRRPTVAYDVAGAYPVAALAAAGDPASMAAAGDDTLSRKPVLRWVVGAFVSAIMDHAVIINRGAAILGAVDAYEQAGYSVQVDIEMHAIGGDDTRLTVTVPLKRAGEPLDIDRAAFMLAHPAFFRRLMFARMESYPTLEGAFGGSYGYTDKQHTGPADADLYFPPLGLTSPHPLSKAAAWTTPETAARTLEAALLA